MIRFVLRGTHRRAKGVFILGRRGLQIGDGNGDVVQLSDHGILRLSKF